MTAKPYLGSHGRKAVYFDVERLMETRLLLCANSGAGKSWAIRRLLEQTHGQIQHIVIDVEDEFHTLREKFDYVLAGRAGGDCPAEPRSAGLLARKLLELGTSCIIGIYELKKHERFAFVRAFIDGLMEAPKSLWHPCLVVIDEAHLFAPEKGKAESTTSVIDLMTRGRKRGFCGVLATQRIAKLHKDASAEANNKLIGRFSQDVDMKRAADELGFSTKKDVLSLRELRAGEFYQFGPAFGASYSGVQKIKVSDVVTTHPKAGQRQAPPPPPRKKLMKVLGELKDIPGQAKQEIRDLAAAKQEITKLRTELTRSRSQDVKQMDAKTVQAAYEKGKKDGLKEFMDAQGEVLFGGYEMVQQNVQEVTDTIQQHLSHVQDQLKQLKTTTANIKKSATKKNPTPRDQINRQTLKQAGAQSGRWEATKPNVSNKPRPAPATSPDPSGNGHDPDFAHIRGGARRLVEVLVQCRSARFTKPQWASLANLRHTSGTFGTYLSQIRTAGLVDESEGLFSCTERAVEWLDAAAMTSPTTNQEVVDMWKNAIGGTPAKMIDVLLDYHPEDVTREELATQLGISHTSGTFGTYLSKLRSNNLVEVDGQNLRAGEPLLWEPG